MTYGEFANEMLRRESDKKINDVKYYKKGLKTRIWRRLGMLISYRDWEYEVICKTCNNIKDYRVGDYRDRLMRAFYIDRCKCNNLIGGEMDISEEEDIIGIKASDEDIDCRWGRDFEENAIKEYERKMQLIKSLEAEIVDKEEKIVKWENIIKCEEKKEKGVKDQDKIDNLKNSILLRENEIKRNRNKIDQEWETLYGKEEESIFINITHEEVELYDLLLRLIPDDSNEGSLYQQLKRDEWWCMEGDDRKKILDGLLKVINDEKWKFLEDRVEYIIDKLVRPKEYFFMKQKELLIEKINKLGERLEDFSDIDMLNEEILEIHKIVDKYLVLEDDKEYSIEEDLNRMYEQGLIGSPSRSLSR